MASRRIEANAEGRRRLFSCKYCDKAFTSSQALGGHQNGHRRERDIVNKVHQDPKHYFSFQNHPSSTPLPPSLPNFGYSSALSHQALDLFQPDLNRYQNYNRYEPYHFYNKSHDAGRVDAGSSSGNYLFGSNLGADVHWDLPNTAGMDAAARRRLSLFDGNDKERRWLSLFEGNDKENDIDLTLHL